MLYRAALLGFNPTQRWELLQDTTLQRWQLASYYDPLAGLSVIAVPGASILVSSAVPLIVSGVNVESPAAGVAVSSAAPTVSTGTWVDVPLASISVAVSAPDVLTGTGISVPPAITLVSAAAPDVLSGVNMHVPASEVSVSALAPAVGSGQLIGVPFAAVTVASDAPAVASGASLSAPASNIAVAAFAPSVAAGVLVEVPAASLAVQPIAPSVHTGTGIFVAEAVVSVSAEAPELAAGVLVETPAAPVGVSPQAPVVSGGAVVSVETAIVGVAVEPPSVSAGASVTSPASSVAVGTSPPAVLTGASVSSPAAGVAVDVAAPTIETGAALTVPAASIVLDVLPPSVAAGVAVAAPSASVSVTAFAPDVSSGVSIAPPAASVSVAPFEPTVEAEASPLSAWSWEDGETMRWEDGNPIELDDVAVAVPVASVVVAAVVPEIGAGVVLNVPAAAIAVDTDVPSVSAGAFVSIPAATVAVAASAPEIDAEAEPSVVEVITDAGIGTNLQIALDAGDINSYSTGQQWVDLKNSLAFNRGSTSGTNSSDPAFIGTPGAKSAAEYFQFDGGDFLTLDGSNPTWVNNMHKSGGEWTFAVWAYLGSVGTDQAFAGTAGSDTGWWMRSRGSDHDLQMRIYNAGSSQFSGNSSSMPGLQGGWAMYAVSWHHNTSRILAYGTADGFVSASGTSALGDPATVDATNPLQIGAAGGGLQALSDGSRVGMVFGFDAALDATQLETLFDSTKDRYLTPVDELAQIEYQAADTDDADRTLDMNEYFEGEIDTIEVSAASDFSTGTPTGISINNTNGTVTFDWSAIGTLSETTRYVRATNSGGSTSSSFKMRVISPMPAGEKILGVGPDHGFRFVLNGTDNPAEPFLLSHHGLSGMTSGSVYGASDVADMIDSIVYSPHFPSSSYTPAWPTTFASNDYQRAGAGDLAPLLLETVRRDLGSPTKPALIFGHSAGGQWVSRTAARYPSENVLRYVVANPSTHAFPIRPGADHGYPDSVDWPYGFGGLGLTSTQEDDLIAAYLQRPVTIYIGELDNEPYDPVDNPDLGDPNNDLGQGISRYERAVNVFAAAEAAATRLGVTLRWHFVEAEGIGHSGGGMIDAPEVMEAFYPPIPTSPDVNEPGTISGSGNTGDSHSVTGLIVTGFPTPTLTYQWRDGGVAISGATSATYTPTEAIAALTRSTTATNDSGSDTGTTPAVEIVEGAASTVVDDLDTAGIGTNLQFALDAGDSGSYSSGQTWTDLKNGLAFHRGSTDSAEASDPTFNGTPGGKSSSEYWSFDGADQFILSSSTPAWIDTIHKTGASFTFAAWVYLGTLGVEQSIIGNVGSPDGGTSRYGIELHFRSTDSQLRFRIYSGNSSSVALGNTSSAIGLQGEWGLYGMSFTYNTERRLFRAVQSGFTSGTGGSTYSASSSNNSPQKLKIGAGSRDDSPLSSGTRLGMVFGFDAGLSLTDLQTLFDTTKARYGIT